MLVSERALYKALKTFQTIDVIDALKEIHKLTIDYRKSGREFQDSFFKDLYQTDPNLMQQELYKRRINRLHAVFRMLIGEAPYYQTLIRSLMESINGTPLSESWSNNQD